MFGGQRQAGQEVSDVCSYTVDLGLSQWRMSVWTIIHQDVGGIGSEIYLREEISLQSRRFMADSQSRDMPKRGGAGSADSKNRERERYGTRAGEGSGRGQGTRDRGAARRDAMRWMQNQNADPARVKPRTPNALPKRRQLGSRR